jgi:Phytanoyl-CoA dioxygenase (PhyH)
MAAMSALPAAGPQAPPPLRVDDDPAAWVGRLEDDGFAVLSDVLDDSMVQALRKLSDAELERQSREHFEQFRFHGSMLPLDLSDATARALIVWPAMLRALERFGFSDPKWLSGYIISKPPNAPPLWWHQDWWAWDEPASFASTPPQLFVMYYLADVGPDNGCLRVIPGSHRVSHPLHAELPEAHSETIGQAELTGPAHRLHPDEVCVRARAGDAVVGDVRLLHATHSNASRHRRTCLTLWYLPDFAALPESVKAYVVQHPALPPAGWWHAPQAVPAELRARLPTYDGTAEPASYNRTPPAQWPDEAVAATSRR